MKVLIISHNPISLKTNMGKTFMSLFSSFSMDELCQLYIYPTYPDIKVCTSYYRVTDKDVLKSCFVCGRPGAIVNSEKIEISSGLYENPKDEGFYQNTKNKTPLRILLRDVIWKLAPWYNQNMVEWLETQNPSCIFVAPGNAKFLYDIALKVSKKRNIPIVSYVCDDYYFVKPSRGGLGRFQWLLLRKKITQLMMRSNHLISICNEIGVLYSDRFQCATATIMTGASFLINNNTEKLSCPQSISYFGNVRCNRYLSLLEVANALDEINRQEQTKYRLKIYTAEKDEDILNLFRGIECVELCGFLIGDDYSKALLTSDYLLHVESFDDASIDLVKHSISTKIPDSLASGKLLLAYGPENVASIRYLDKNKCAVVAKNLSELKSKLRCLFDENNRVSLEQIILKAKRVANKYHSNQVNSQKLRDILMSL